MKVCEAKEVARRWLEETIPTLVGYKGAIMVGSINSMDPQSEWPATSDIDMWPIVEDAKLAPRQKKLVYHGVIIEFACRSLEHCSDPEEVLGDAHMAHHLAADSIVSDPTGILTKVHNAVRVRFAEPQWVRKRLDSINGNARRYLTKMGDDSKSLTGRTMSMALGIRNVAAQCPIARLANPTFRKCLIVSREILTSVGREDLCEELLEVLGSRSFRRSDAEELREVTIPMFEYATQIVKTPFWAQFELAACVRPIAIGGITEMIEGGFHRESVSFSFFIQNVCMEAIKNDAPEDEKARHMNEFKKVLSALGIKSPEEMGLRGRQGLEVLDKIYAVMVETIGRG